MKKSQLLAEIENLTEIVNVLDGAIRKLNERVAELEARPVIQLPKMPDENRPYIWPVPTCPQWPPQYPIITYAHTYTTNTDKK